MLLNHLDLICKGTLWLMVFIFLSSGWAYLVNARRKADDPKKKDFHPMAILLAPFTWPFLLFGIISIFIIKAILYGVFLVLFTLLLIFYRKPFLLAWLEKIMLAIGNKLLEANTALIKLLRSPWIPQPT